jgi:hypothetical protein
MAILSSEFGDLKSPKKVTPFFPIFDFATLKKRAGSEFCKANTRYSLNIPADTDSS